MGNKLIRGRWIVTNPDLAAGGIILDGAVAVENDTIAAVGPYSDLMLRYPSAEQIGSGGQMVLPGFVNAHHHGQGLTTLQQGIADDYLERWLPSLRAAMKPFDIYLDTLYASLRLIRSGVTTVIHSGYARDPRKVASETRDSLRAYVDSGLRVAYAVPVMDRNHFVYQPDEQFIGSLPANLSSQVTRALLKLGGTTSEDFFRLLDELLREFEGDPKVKILAGPSGPHSCSDDLLVRIRRAIDRSGTGIHMHCLETVYQRDFAFRSLGKSWIEHLHSLGILGPDLSLAHGVWLNERDIEICAAANTSICHNASSNLRLRSGILPLVQLVAEGVNVAIGMDGMALGDADDMLEEMRVVSSVHRLPRYEGYVGRPTSLEILKMAIANGARASGFGPAIGALEAGRRADIVLVDPTGFGPLDSRTNIVDAMIARGRAHDVDTVLIGGDLLLHDKRFVRHDIEEIEHRLIESAARKQDLLLQEWMDVLDRVRPHIENFYRDRRITAHRPLYAIHALDQP